MILYDSEPQTTSCYPLAKFQGNRLRDRDRTVYQSFNKAKKASRAFLKGEIKELMDRLERLESTTEDNCPTIDNPFN